MARAAVATCDVCELHAEAVFRVEGMDCNEEVVILERRLKPLPGMEALSADVVGQRLHVKYDAAKLTTSAMVEAVGQTGMRMWLEHEEPRTDSADVRWRFYLMGASGIAIVAGMLAARGGLAAVSIACHVIAAVLGGVYPARRAITALRTRTVDINVLMVIAIAGALALRDWAEASAVVFLFALAQWLEVRTLERARQAIRALLDLSPRKAIVRRGGRDESVDVEDIGSGDLVLVRPGDKVAVDGVVESGTSDVNEAPITGESLPVDKQSGDPVYAGTINGRGALEVRVTRVGRDTRVARIIHLVEVAQSERAPVQTFVDRFGRIYTPAVIALALVVALVPPAVAGASFGPWVYRALVLLVISCPCALVISTPVSIVAALSAAARNGVLIKGGAHLERLADARIIAFDKTGTLTRGELQVVDVVPIGAAAARDIVRYAAAVEARSEHPVARAVMEYARHTTPDVPAASAFVSLPGLGAEAQVAGRLVVVGNAALLESRGIVVPPSGDGDGGVASARTYVAVDGSVHGVLVITDRVRDTAREAIDLLRAQGVRRMVMLTGDRAASAQQIAEAIGLDEYRAGLLPEHKHAAVRALRDHGGAVLMLGDGVNDAPALAAADVGIAMGAAGSDVALETADVALMSDELLKLPYAIRLARATLRNVKTNVAVSLLLKAAFLVLALSGTATLWMAVLADTGASVIVVANALRLLRAR
jgi:Zn2+/Cd2+-exporting ATPase